MNVAIIPARGGSRRIPGKNIKLFHGKPIIAYSIETALASSCFDRVIVSTDDKETADISIQYGAEVPFMRPDDISDDYTTSMDVVRHSISWLDEHGITSKMICCIYATAPFLTTEYLIAGRKKLEEFSYVEYVFGATSYAFPIQRAIKLSPQGQVEMMHPENLLVRSQDLEEVFHDAGQFYWGRKEAFLNKLPIFSEHSRVVLIPRSRVQDIDTPEDWAYAEKIYKVPLL